MFSKSRPGGSSDEFRPVGLPDTVETVGGKAAPGHVDLIILRDGIFRPEKVE